MERSVGEKFEIDGCVYEVVLDDPEHCGKACKMCAFTPENCGYLHDVRGYCTGIARDDGFDVHYVRLGGGTESQSQKGGE